MNISKTFMVVDIHAYQADATLYQEDNLWSSSSYMKETNVGRPTAHIGEETTRQKGLA